jgi:hypothetical protein
MREKSVFRSLLMMVGLIALALVATASTSDTTARARTVMNLSFRGLEDLGPGWAYEGWFIVNGTPISTGTFTVDEHGKISQRRFVVNVSRTVAKTFVLTIEPSPDPDPAPSDTHVLAGKVRGSRALLRVTHPAALGSNFRDASGSFILGVPTDQSGSTPYTNGIWFLDAAAGPGPSLNLPELPAGWRYEGWVVGPNGPISTGTFLTAAGADSDGGGAYAGPDAGPPFPGQDFVSPAMSLLGYSAVISIEPYPDNSPAPFAFKPLVLRSIQDPGAPGVPQQLDNNARSLATGMVRIR